ncbi:hypothetical protein MPH_10810 [Macrophomina phaseolina MS6]|uniref:DUF7730 domain-containing protein n=1 Tax=Macrophomina phaseolina (strain MS6) TaxID=1126212 RepID=K2RPL1_MACPH|nr:hypothetical protein MPH_10810 [Macrophomina phaseolina MS6]
MASRGRRTKRQAPPKLVEPFKLNGLVDPGPFSHFLPQSMNKHVLPILAAAESTTEPTAPSKDPSAPPKKRKRDDIPHWRDYPKRARKQISYADVEESDDSAFYDSDDNNESAIAQKKTKIDRPLPKRRIFPFLSLPRELRDMIYEYAVGSPTTVHIPDKEPYTSKTIYIIETQARYRHHARRADRTNCSKRYEVNPIAASLLGVNKQIHAEAAPVLYSANRFRFSDPVAMHTFVNQLSRPTRGLLRSVELSSWFARRSYCCAFNSAVFGIMAEGCTGVREFRFWHWTYERQPRWEARRIYRWAYQWLDVLAATKKGGVAEVLSVLSKGVERWGEKWQVGNENWEEFSREFVRLMTVGANGDEDEDEELDVKEEEEDDDDDDEYVGRLR